MKKITMALCSAWLLFIMAGCSNPFVQKENTAKLYEMKVVEKTKNVYTRNTDYFVVLERNNQRIQLSLSGDNYQMLSKDDVVNVVYDKDMNEIQTISFPNLEKDSK